LVGLGLNVQWGQCGLVNFGIAGVFATGAYVTAITGLAGQNPIIAMAAAAAAGAVASGSLALLAARLEGDYLAIVTLGFAEVIRLITLNENWLTNGALGLSGIPRPFEHLFPGVDYQKVLLIFTFLVLGTAFAVLQILSRSPFGRALRAVRDDDVVAAALGKHPVSLRVKAFALGGAVIGLAGALHAFYLTYIDPSQFTTAVTAYAFMAVIAGGRGSHVGLLLGAGFIMLLLEATRFLKDLISFVDGAQLEAMRLAMIGVGIIALLVFRPQGLMSEPRLHSRDLAPFDEGTDDGPSPIAAP
jgi:ABC-type branched-subunit amino acid transport system permease subunit